MVVERMEFGLEGRDAVGENLGSGALADRRITEPENFPAQFGRIVPIDRVRRIR